MKKFIQNKLKEQKGLTLIELLAVIVILAIIAAIAIPAIGNIIENSRVGAAKSDALNVLNAAVLYETDGNALTATTTVKDLVDGGFLESPGNIATDSEVAPGPVLTYTFADIVGGNDLIFNQATIADINASSSNSELREALETGPQTIGVTGS